MLECPDGRQPTALVGFGVISLKEGCTITSREFHYPHTFRGIVEISISSGAFNKEVTIGWRDGLHSVWFLWDRL